MARLVLGLAMLALASLAAAQEPAAVVSRYLPANAEHSVARGDGTTTILALGMPLFANDVVAVSSDGSVVLTYADGESAQLAGGSSFTVPEREPLGFVAQVFGRLQTVLSRQYKQGANLATRGDGACADGVAATPLTAPALAAESYLVEGHADLSLAWVGGCSPYSLELASKAGQTYGATRLGRPQARLDTPNLGPGEYTLTIRDARGQTFAARVIVRDAAPKGPFAGDSDSSELRAVAYAAWLANEDDGRWRWESFQVLRPWIRGGSTLAGTYGDLVLWGDPRLAASDD